MKESYMKIIFIILISILLLIAIYIGIFSGKEKILAISKLKEDHTNIFIADNIRIGIMEFDTINPILSNNKNVQDVSRLIFEPLFTLTQDYKLEGILAKECTKIENNTYIIKLNENVFWHDEKRFDSSDVIFTINSIKELKDNSIYYHNIQNIKYLEEIDEYTIKIITDKDIPYFEYNLIFPIISSKYFNKLNIKSESKNIKPVGTGMFYISDVNNENILLKKNPENNKANNLKLETITLNTYSSLSTVIKAFKEEKVDMFMTSNKSIEEYLKNIKYNAIQYINREYNYLALNCESKVLSNKEVRQAINYGLNKEEIYENVFNNKCQASYFPLDFGNFAYDKNNNISIYDINKAKKVLVESGWRYSEEGWNNSDNLKIELDLIVNKNEIDNIKVANNIKEQLKDIGIVVNVKENNNTEYNNYLKNKNYDIILLNTNYGYSPSLEKYFGKDNIANYTDEEINNSLKEVEFFDNENEIKEKYTQIIDIYNEHIPYISLYYNINTLIYSDSLRGVILPNSYNIFYGIETWYREYIR